MTDQPLRVLERFVRPRPVPRAGERCELCATDIPDAHGHLVDLHTRNLVCACRACYLLFTPDGAGGARHRAVPDRYLALSGVALTPAQWDALQVPVGVAFLFRSSSADGWVAFYPGPAGATESLLPLEAWEEIRAAHPVLDDVRTDVEAVLVRHQRDGSSCHVVPIDACYALIGTLRQLWRGFDGGKEARDALEGFFARVNDRAKPAPPA